MRKKTRKNGFWNGVFFTLFLMGVIIIFGKFFLPTILAKKIAEDDSLKNSISFLQAENIPLEEAIRIVEDINKEDVSDAFSVINNKETLTDHDKLSFLRKMGIDEKYHAAMLKKMTTEDLEIAAKKYEKHKERIKTFFPLIKETLIESIKTMEKKNASLN